MLLNPVVQSHRSRTLKVIMLLKSSSLIFYFLFKRLFINKNYG
jgi:hypothetical protein